MWKPRTLPVPVTVEVASPRGPKQGALEAGLWVYQFLVFRVLEAWRRS